MERLLCLLWQGDFHEEEGVQVFDVYISPIKKYSFLYFREPVEASRAGCDHQLVQKEMCSSNVPACPGESAFYSSAPADWVFEFVCICVFVCMCICDSLYFSICRPPTTHAERLSGQLGAFAASLVGRVSELVQDGSSIGWGERSVLMWILSIRISARAVALVCQVVDVLVIMMVVIRVYFF